MGARLICPHCKASYLFSKEYDGKAIRCKTCDGAFRVRIPIAPPTPISPPAPVVEERDLAPLPFEEIDGPSESPPPPARYDDPLPIEPTWPTRPSWEPIPETTPAVIALPPIVLEEMEPEDLRVPPLPEATLVLEPAEELAPILLDETTSLTVNGVDAQQSAPMPEASLASSAFLESAASTPFERSEPSTAAIADERRDDFSPPMAAETTQANEQIPLFALEMTEPMREAPSITPEPPMVTGSNWLQTLDLTLRSDLPAPEMEFAEVPPPPALDLPMLETPVITAAPPLSLEPDEPSARAVESTPIVPDLVEEPLPLPLPEEPEPPRPEKKKTPRFVPPRKTTFAMRRREANFRSAWLKENGPLLVVGGTIMAFLVAAILLVALVGKTKNEPDRSSSVDRRRHFDEPEFDPLPPPVMLPPQPPVIQMPNFPQPIDNVNQPFGQPPAFEAKKTFVPIVQPKKTRPRQVIPENDRVWVKLLPVGISIDPSAKAPRVNGSPVDEAAKGTTYNYLVDLHARTDEVKARLEMGPEGLKIAPNGRITWEVPKNYPYDDAEVSLRFSHTDGECLLSYRIYVR